MSEPHPTAPAATAKPAKLYPDFPLFQHAAGVWAEKIRGKMHYFGPWDDPDGARKRYDEQKEALHSGRKPRSDAEGVTVKDVANTFLNAKLTRVESGELSRLSLKKYRDAIGELVAHIGKGRLASDLDPADFESLRERMAAKWGPYRLGDCIQHIRSAFKHAYDSGLIPVPTRFGPSFKGPSCKALRLHRAAQGPKLFTREEVRALLDAAGVQVRAMILLGINCGFGNNDCGTLPLSTVNLDTGWIAYPRPKTGIARRCPLWPETMQALHKARGGQNEGKMRVHAVGIRRIVGFWSVDVHDPRAFEKNRHCITDAGLGNLLDSTARYWEMERRLNKTIVHITEEEVGGRACTRIETNHPDRNAGSFYGYRCLLWLDKATHLPVGAETYDWPHSGGSEEGDLLESYRFIDLRCNIRLSDDTFNH